MKSKTCPKLNGHTKAELGLYPRTADSQTGTLPSNLVCQVALNSYSPEGKSNLGLLVCCFGFDRNEKEHGRNLRRNLGSLPSSSETYLVKGFSFFSIFHLKIHLFLLLPQRKLYFYHHLFTVKASALFFAIYRGNVTSQCEDESRAAPSPRVLYVHVQGMLLIPWLQQSCSGGDLALWSSLLANNYIAPICDVLCAWQIWPIKEEPRSSLFSFIK